MLVIKNKCCSDILTERCRVPTPWSTLSTYDIVLRSAGREQLKRKTGILKEISRGKNRNNAWYACLVETANWNFKVVWRAPTGSAEFQSPGILCIRRWKFGFGDSSQSAG